MSQVVDRFVSDKNTIHTVSISLVKETDESDHSFLPSNTHP